MNFIQEYKEQIIVAAIGLVLFAGVNLIPEKEDALGALPVIASAQLAGSPTADYILSTDGSVNSWIANSGGGGSGTDNDWNFFNDSAIRLGTTTNQVLIGTSATSTSGNLEVGGSAHIGDVVATNTLSVANLSTLTGGFLSNASSTVNGDFVVTGSCTGCGSGSGDPFAWATHAEGVSTSTRLVLGNGFISQASSTIDSTLVVTGTITGNVTGNLTGNADTVSTNANLTGHITSTGNAAILGSFTEAQLETAVSDDNPLFDGDIGSNVQAWDAELDTIAGLTETTGNVIIAVGSAWASVAQPIIDCTNCTNVSGSGDPFAWTTTADGVSTSTLLEFDAGFISRASSTIDGTLVVTGADLEIAQDLQHLGDSDTYLRFSTNQISFASGASTASILTSDGYTINPVNDNNFDFQVDSANGDYALYMFNNVSDTVRRGYIGIGTSTPQSQLTVDGSFLVVGQIEASSTATSTFAQGIDIDAGCFAIAGTCLSTGGAETNSLESTITGIADTEIFIGSGVDAGAFLAISGDATLANTGALTVVDDSHNHVYSNLDPFTEANLYTILSDVTQFWEAGDTLSSGSISSGFGNIDIGASNFDADGTITSTGVIDFGGATSVEITNTANPTVNASGELAIDTTSGSSSLHFYDGTTEFVLDPDFDKSLVSLGSTTMGIGGSTYDAATSTFLVWLPTKAVTLNEFQCISQVGTVNVQIGDGAASSTALAVSTTIATDTSPSNNTFSQYEGVYVALGDQASSADGVTCTFNFKNTP